MWQERWIPVVGAYEDGPVLQVHTAEGMLRLLGDTGAQISLLHKPVKGTPLLPCTIRPRGLGGYLSPVGEQLVGVSYAGKTITHQFLIANVQLPGLNGIMGVDLMTQFGLAVWWDIGRSLGLGGIDLGPDWRTQQAVGVAPVRGLRTVSPEIERERRKSEGQVIAQLVRLLGELEKKYNGSRGALPFPSKKEGVGKK